MNQIQKQLLIAAGIFALLVLVYFYLDAQVALAIHNGNFLQLQSISMKISLIGEPGFWGVVATLGLIGVILSRYQRGWNTGLTQREQQLTYVCLSILLALLIADIGKYLLGRERPVLLFDNHMYGFAFLAHDWAKNSMPSGHAVAIFAVATCLSSVWPRYLILFFIIATIVGISRILAVQHYPADVLAGAYLGVMTAYFTKRFLLRYWQWSGLIKHK